MLVLWKRWFTHAQASSSQDDGETTELRVAAIQEGDENLREALIIQYRPFIAKTASRFCRRFIDPDRDDEFSVALAAFDEAINRFSPEAGGRFIGFAETVITRRLIDHVRQEQRHSASVPYSSLADPDDDGEGVLSRIESAAALEIYERDLAAERRKAEIAMLSEQLAQFGIRFADLAEGSPRHRDSRLTLLGIGKRLAGNPALYQALLDKRQLPVKELCISESVSRKTVERHRKYLIAVSLIAGGPYPCLQDYINPEPGGKERV
nr:RNA polymerase sigma-I factor [Cohnella sp. CFH 77786]